MITIYVLESLFDLTSYTGVAKDAAKHYHS